jgi:antitoxin component YwqK of YwqJK toxin-antitoxin module
MIKNILKSKYVKAVILVLLFAMPVPGFSQNKMAMEDVESRREVSMAYASGKRTNGIYRYYAKGEEQPFTGILFAKYPNGNYASWQEYVDGVGQGKWINYYENGNPKEVGHYNQNLVEGPIKKYYQNGVLQAEGNYKDWRVMIGKWKYYDQKGNLESTKDYGSKGSIEEVQKFYDSGEISYSWYANILTKNGFKPQ